MKNSGELHKGHRQRLKQRTLTVGADKIEIHELLELMLTYTIPYKDVNPLAHHLLQKYGSFNAVLDAGYEDLITVDGVGHETALFLSLFPSIFSRYSCEKKGEPVLATPLAVAEYFKSKYRIGAFEDFYLFCLDGSFRLKKTVVINGDRNSSISFNSNVISSQLANSRSGYVVILHSHTINDLRPSKADLVATKRIISISYMMGCTVMDHLIINRAGQYYSFKANGLLDKLLIDVNKSLNNLAEVDMDNVDPPPEESAEQE